MSGLNASMWTSVSGLTVHGNKMNVVGNNLANVSTIGFKSQRADFSDYLYVGGGSVSGNTQVGQGAATYALIGDFSQGSFQSSNSVTDIAIDGNGFFKVRKPNTEGMYYTRAGDFYFNSDRELQNPEGYLLQGWRVENNKSISFSDGSTTLGIEQVNKSPFIGTGTAKDIVLDSWNIVPQQTTNVTFTMGLTNDDGSDNTSTSDGTDPMTALFRTWDGRKTPPMADTAYAAQSSIKVYDQGGTTHDLTVYYDKVNTSRTTGEGATKSTLYEIDALPPGYMIYEYVVTMNPSEDKRTYGGTGYTEAGGWSNPEEIKTFSDTKAAGMLMTGHLIFNASGELVDQTAYTYAAQDTNLVDAEGNPTNTGNQSSLDPTELDSWQPTTFSSNGLPVFSPNFEGLPLSNSVRETISSGTDVVSEVEDHIIELDFGIRGGASTSTKTLADLADRTNSEAPYAPSYANLSLMNSPTREDYASAANAVTPTVQDAVQDGYGSGVLNNVNIDNSGVIYGIYSNGKTLPMYQIALYDFKCEQGLYREGGNLFSATRQSGEPREGVPGDNGFGSTSAYNIEQSNVDMTTEFVQMISTQRGFQANSKAITTTDTMLETVIGMKR